jgi:hypothetical protein
MWQILSPSWCLHYTRRESWDSGSFRMLIAPAYFPGGILLDLRVNLLSIFWLINRDFKVNLLITIMEVVKYGSNSSLFFTINVESRWYWHLTLTSFIPHLVYPQCESNLNRVSLSPSLNGNAKSKDRDHDAELLSALFEELREPHNAGAPITIGGHSNGSV